MNLWKRVLRSVLLVGVVFIIVIRYYFILESSNTDRGLYANRRPIDHQHLLKHAHQAALDNSASVQAISLSRTSIVTSIPSQVDTSAPPTTAASISIPSCTDRYCTSLLTRKELTAFKQCQDEVLRKTGVHPNSIESSCRFMNGTGRKVVGLVSETGSGNTWVRGLLEKATGVCTGAIYCDAALRNSGMIGENVTGSSVLVVKTHTPDYQWLGVPHPDRQSDPIHTDGYYQAAIILIRNPFHAFVSEWNRFVKVEKLENYLLNQSNVTGVLDNSHTYRLRKEMFGANRRWTNFLKSIRKRWCNVYTKWYISAVTHKIPVLVVRFEDIKRDRVGQVEKMLNFLNFEYTHTDIPDKIQEDFTMFRRDHDIDQFEHYTDRQRRLVNTYILRTARELKHYDTNNSFRLEEYVDKNVQ